MKKQKRVVSTLLLAAIIASLLVSTSCGQTVENDDGITSSNQDGTTDTGIVENDPVDKRSSVTDDLPEKKFGGYGFTVLTDTGLDWTIIQPEETGDVIDDSIYRRNITVEDRFGIKLNVLMEDPGNLGSKITSSVQAGDDDIDLVCGHVVFLGSLALEDMFLNWYDIPYIDFSKPWWSESTTDDLSVNDVCPLAISDFALSALANTYCVFYNKRLAENYGITDLYDIVNEGKWTIDKVLSLTKDIYTDLDADNTANGADLYGFISTARSSLNTYLWSFGWHVLEKDANGDVSLVYHSPKTNDFIEKLCSFYFDNQGIYINSKEPEYSSFFALEKFTNNEAVFINGAIGNSVEYLRSMEDDYGIIPYPKWDEAQDGYHTMVDGSHDILGIPKTASDKERTSIIVEALSAESYKKVVPAYYETALKTKYTRDDESIAMIDMIVNSRVFDLGYVYDAWNGASFIFQTLISANKPIFESYWASNEKKITTYYNDKVIAFFENYDK